MFSVCRRRCSPHFYFLADKIVRNPELECIHTEGGEDHHDEKLHVGTFHDWGQYRGRQVLEEPCPQEHQEECAELH